MNQDITLAKLASTATPSAWAQAYSTLNFYVALSVQQTQESNSIVATEGKEILERLQREFFALDEKSLTTIKTAVENTIAEIPSSILFSIVLATVKNGVLYIIIASEGSVVLKRDEALGTVAKGTEGQVHGFSGELRPSDVVILQTKAFAEKVPFSRISYYLYSQNPNEISENIAPLVHENSQGTEAAIIMTYKPHSSSTDTTPQSSIYPDEPESSHSSQETPHESEVPSPKRKLPSFPSVKFSRIHDPRRMMKDKKILGIGIIILLFILAISIYTESVRREQNKREEELQAIITPALKGLEEAETLMSLDKTLALDELIETEELLVSKRDYFKEGSEEDAEIESLLEQVISMKQTVEQGNQIKDQTTVATSNGLEIPSIDLVSSRGDDIVVVSTSEDTALTLTDSGSVDAKYEYDSGTALSLTSDSQFIYILTDTNVVRIDKGNKRTQTIIDDTPSNVSEIDIFGSNVYLLSFSPGNITRHAAPSYSERNYFANTPVFTSSLSSFAIDGSIWILQSDGTIKRYTRGSENPVEIKGLVTPIGKDAKIYTEEEFSKVYVLDPARSRLLIFEKTGTLSTQLEWNEFRNAQSFAINEASGTGFITTGSTLYSFSLGE